MINLLYDFVEYSLEFVLASCFFVTLPRKASKLFVWSDTQIENASYLYSDLNELRKVREAN